MPAQTHLRQPSLIFRLVLAACFATSISPAFAAQTATTTTLSITVAGKAVTEAPAGEAVTFTASVAAGMTPITSGTVNFCDSDTSSCSDIHLFGSASLGSAGQAAISFQPPPGPHAYKAEFIGTFTEAVSSSAATALTVNAITATTIAQTGAQGNYTLVATVAGKGLITAPSGTVSMEDTSNGNTVLGSAKLVPGVAGTTAWSNSSLDVTQPAPQVVTMADFNGDGIPDLAVGTNLTSDSNKNGYLSVLLGNGDGTFQKAQSFAAFANNTAIAAAAFTNGGPVDILTVFNSSSDTNNAAILTGDGKGGGTFGTPFSPGLASASAIAVGDFNQDGKVDFIVSGTAFGTPAVEVVPGNGNGTFGTGTLFPLATSATALATGDFNGDGSPDWVAASTDGTISVYLNDREGSFSPAGGGTAGTLPVALATGDFNGDGKLDLAVVDQGSNDVTILLGDGTGNLTLKATASAGSAPTSIAVGDFNHDGIADLAVTNSGDATVTILLGNGDGTFTPAAPLTTGVNPLSVVAGNFGGTGLDALAVANGDPSNIETGTLTLLASTLAQSATATVTGIAPSGTGSHLVDASYAGDGNYAGSVSATTMLMGSASSSPTVSISPTSLSFPAEPVSETSAAQTVTITNTSAAALTISAVKASTNFAVTSTCAATLAAGSSCVLSVTFTPATAGDLTGTLTLTDNAAGSPQTVALNGTGSTVGVSATSTMLSVATPGGAATTAISLSAEDGFSGTVNLTCAVKYLGSGTATNPPTCALSPTQLQLSGTGPGKTTLTVETTGATAAFLHDAMQGSGAILATMLLFMIVPRRRRNLFFLLMGVAVLASAIGCGSNHSTIAPPSEATTAGPYSVVVTATSSSLIISTTISLNVESGSN